ncbi:ctr copper transporter family protein [Penicillium cf. viridicatum]|uniref:Ctr copper transporter family protein n=1 Tax=Penicillium cf. viridicatum TaxID=2972119 RepID=A0A9W9JK49_9EURO|nr:ctr copper transporter family protein [Penicillium cf. viridicatum]
MTAYTKDPAAPNLVLAVDTVPAASLFPRFAGLSTGYVVASTNLGRRAIADLDFSTQDTVAIGELATASATVAVNYTGPVVVITGEQDAVGCFVNPIVRGHCGRGDASKPAQVRYLFPSASTFSFFVPEGVGHDINFHYGV